VKTAAVTGAGLVGLVGLVGLAGLVAVSSCAHPPPYTPPSAPSAPAFKENADWKLAQPADQAARGDWWAVFGDPQLDALQHQIDISNQNLKVVEAQFAAARAAVRAARSSLYPQVSAAPAATASEPSGNRAIPAVHQASTDFLLPVDVSYEVDAWGRIHSAVNASQAAAQASAADVETARLSLHAELALDYFALRGLGREKTLLDQAAASYEQALALTQNRFQGGLASQADVAFAETQLETTRAEAKDLEVDSAALEHAIAVLVGEPASAFSLTVSPDIEVPPVIPPEMPSALLERRPDIAAAERRVAAANAQVGVANAAFYPIVTLSGAAGFESSSIGRLLTGASSLWSVGPAALVNVFDAGRRRAVSDQARAAYDAATASYRAAVLSAFRDVEDQLATLRVLGEEAQIQDRATAAAERSLTLATNRYRGGIVSYLDVITAQNAALANERASVSILLRRISASVLLLKSLGGTWTK
jgi:NodT family efflux transporter outer membrane factor (OMF) lipoprotein